MATALLIPSYEPRQRVVEFLSQFKQGEFDYFLVVDDGSGKDYDDVFSAIAEKTVFQVDRYEINRGKGHALKHGMKLLLDAHPDIDSIVTADSDGQHLHDDILKVKEACLAHPESLVLGSRNFENAPEKSRSGNKWSSRYFLMMTGTYIIDTQTGLRGIPKCLIPLSLSTHGDRFEYEMNFLLDAARVAKLEQVEITTVYENGKNEGTHFRPFKDSMRIASGLIGYVVALLAFFLIDFIAFLVGKNLIIASKTPLDSFYGLALLSMGIATICHFLLCQFWAFKMKKPILGVLWKTALIYVGMAGLQALVVFLFHSSSGLLDAMTVLFAFLMSFALVFIDHNWIYRPKGIKA